MKINIAKSAGFCFGVRRAIDIAFKTAKCGRKIEMLSNVVHNEDVVNQIKRLGIEKIKKLSSKKNKILLISAHGACKTVIQKAKNMGYEIIDATCPMVKEIHKIVKTMEKKGCKIIIIGDKKHAEVHGIIGQLKNKPIIINDYKSIPYAMIERIQKAAVVVQSTQNMEKSLEIMKTLKKQIASLKVFNTICLPTRAKQEEIKTMPYQNDVVIIIGSKTSANTKRLYEISKSINKASYWVQSKKDLKKEWFKTAKNAGITAGASTPKDTIEDITEYIKELTK